MWKTSSKLGTNVQDAFEDLIKKILTKRHGVEDFSPSNYKHQPEHFLFSEILEKKVKKSPELTTEELKSIFQDQKEDPVENENLNL